MKKIVEQMNQKNVICKSLEEVVQPKELGSRKNGDRLEKTYDLMVLCICLYVITFTVKV